MFSKKENILKVAFDKTPKVRVRVIDSELDSSELIADKKKFPFKLDEDTHCIIWTTTRRFCFKVPKDYKWNGADIPNILFIFGSSKDNDFLIASMIHDFILEKKEYVFKEVLKNEMTLKEYRRLTSLVFREILKSQKTNVIKANIMAFAVDAYQATLNRKSWDVLNEDN